MNLIPMPKLLEETGGYLNKPTVNVATRIDDARIENALRKLPVSEDGATFEIYRNGADGEAYTLRIEEAKIVLEAGGLQGIFYGIQTLRQLFAGGEVPCLYIEDRPDFKYRGFLLDITRGKIPKVESLKRFVDDMAYYKLNALQLYSEHVFDLKEFQSITRRTGAMTAEEIREIEAYCHQNFIKLIPAVATFGHLYELLCEEPYREMCMLKDYKPVNIYWDERAYHHTLDPLHPKSFKLVRSILDQCTELFASDTINICCDETFDLENYTEKNTGRLYADFVKRIAGHLAAKGKKVMMWSDVILEDMDILGELPEDIQLLTWGYGRRLRKESIQKIAETNHPQIVCPGCNTWARLVENTQISEVNIPGMAELGSRYGAVGVLNTCWGDWGNPCSRELSMYGLVMGAEKSWSVATSIDDAFRDRVNALLYQSEHGTDEVRALSALATAVPYQDLGAYYSNCVCEHGNLPVELPSEEVLRSAQSDLRELICRVRAQQWGNAECRTELLIAAEGILLIAEIFAKLAGYSMERTVDAEQWLAGYRDSWLKKNKASELCELEKMYRFMDRAAGRGV